MSEVKRKGDPKTYHMLDRLCIGRECFSPGIYQIRGATLGGSRNTGRDRATCMHNAYHGCPTERPCLDKLERERKAQGWKNV